MATEEAFEAFKKPGWVALAMILPPKVALVFTVTLTSTILPASMR